MDVAQELGSSSGETCQLVLVTPGTIDLFWEQVIPLFLQSSKYWEEYTSIDGILASILDGERDLWIAMDDGGVFIAMLTEIVLYPKKKVLRFALIGGSNLKKALQFLDFIELMCVRKGIKSSEVWGRQGWLRVLKRNGYKYQSILLSKDLSEVKEH